MLKNIFFVTLSLAILAGCSSTPEAKAEGDKPAMATNTTETATTAEMTKCSACGAEVKTAEMKKDGDNMVCAKCAEAHGVK